MATFTVAVSADDGYYTSALFNNSNTVLIFGNLSAVDYASYMRFAGVTIPQGATITSAILTLRASSGDGNPLTVAFQGVAADSQAAPTTLSNITGWSWTTASVNWALSAGSWSGDQASPEFKTIIQEIVNRSGWSSGNALILGTRVVAKTGQRTAVSKDDFVPPSLAITYTTGETASGGVTISHPTLAGSATVTPGKIGSGGITISHPTLTGTGTVQHQITGSGGTTIGHPLLTGAGTVEAVHFASGARAGGGVLGGRGAAGGGASGSGHGGGALGGFARAGGRRG